jgi:hypothetical protein
MPNFGESSDNADVLSPKDATIEDGRDHFVTMNCGRFLIGRRNTLLSRGFKADDGIRTHDLLHGKQTL